MPARAAEEQAWSLRQSSLLNDAYRTLKEPVARTAYLLKLEGVRIEDENSETRDMQTKQNRVPADLLEEVFELNMQLEEMRANLKMGEDDRGAARRFGARPGTVQGNAGGRRRRSASRLGPRGTLHWMRTLQPRKANRRTSWLRCWIGAVTCEISCVKLTVC